MTPISRNAIALRWYREHKIATRLGLEHDAAVVVADRIVPEIAAVRAYLDRKALTD